MPAPAIAPPTRRDGTERNPAPPPPDPAPEHRPPSAIDVRREAAVAPESPTRESYIREVAKRDTYRSSPPPAAPKTLRGVPPPARTPSEVTKTEVRAAPPPKPAARLTAPPPAEARRSSLPPRVPAAAKRSAMPPAVPAKTKTSSVPPPAPKMKVTSVPPPAPRPATPAPAAPAQAAPPPQAQTIPATPPPAPKPATPPPAPIPAEPASLPVEPELEYAPWPQHDEPVDYGAIGIRRSIVADSIGQVARNVRRSLGPEGRAEAKRELRSMMVAFLRGIRRMLGRLAELTVELEFRLRD